MVIIIIGNSTADVACLGRMPKCGLIEGLIKGCTEILLDGVKVNGGVLYVVLLVDKIGENPRSNTPEIESIFGDALFINHESYGFKSLLEFKRSVPLPCGMNGRTIREVISEA